jgi:hypothetical protein
MRPIAYILFMLNSVMQLFMVFYFILLPLFHRETGLWYHFVVSEPVPRNEFCTN